MQGKAGKGREAAIKRLGGPSRCEKNRGGGSQWKEQNEIKLPKRGKTLSLDSPFVAQSFCIKRKTEDGQGKGAASLRNGSNTATNRTNTAACPSC